MATGKAAITLVGGTTSSKPWALNSSPATRFMISDSKVSSTSPWPFWAKATVAPRPPVGKFSTLPRNDAMNFFCAASSSPNFSCA